MEKTLDLSYYSEYDLLVAKDRTLNVIITCTYIDSGGTEQYFDFSSYSGATLVVKNVSGTILMAFNTTDGSIVLGSNGSLKLAKTALEMDAIRAGCYQYDMYISNAIYPKRAFLRGSITWIQNTAN